MPPAAAIFNRGNQYQFWCIDCQHYFLLKYGLKPVIRVQLKADILKEFQRVWQLLGFHVLIGNFDLEFWGRKIKKPVFCGYLSLRPEPARKAYEAEKDGDREAIGKALGYPACCVKDFIRHVPRQADFDFTINALISSRAKPSFYCNSIFNFESKLSEKKEKILWDNYKIFSACRHLFLIKHLPCSFNCRESMKIGKKTLEILKREMPELARETESVLKKPVLYFDYLDWAIFDGEVENNRLEYGRLLPYRSLFSGEKLDLIKAGDRLVVEDEQIFIYKNKKAIARIKKEDRYRGVLIDFK